MDGPGNTHEQGAPALGRSHAVVRVIEQVRQARAAGERLGDPLIISAHSELMPELGHELEKLKRIEAAWVAATASLSPATPAHAPAAAASVPGPAEIELASALAADLEKPTIEVPGYTVLREIGRGGQAVVFLAVKLNPGRRVALKVMRDGSLANDEALARFKLEAGILTELNHPNIVTILETGLTADGSHFFAMNYIAGCGLDEHMHRRQKVDPDPSKLLRLFLRICDVVNAAHLKQIVHRDLKPGNIRVDEHGEPHILDFGLAGPAVDRSGGADSKAISVTGDFLGSLPWSSPEQAEGDFRKVDVRSDIYSLGVILYQMVTGGRFPYEVVGNVRDVLNNIVTSQPTPPSMAIAAGVSYESDGTHPRARMHPSTVNETIEKIVLKALAKQPEQRYLNAGELGRAIAEYLLGKKSADQAPAEAKPQQQPRQARMSRRRAAVMSASVALLALAIIWRAFFRDSHQAKSPPLQAVANSSSVAVPPPGSADKEPPPAPIVPTNNAGALSAASMASIQPIVPSTQGAVAEVSQHTNPTTLAAIPLASPGTMPAGTGDPPLPKVSPAPAQPVATQTAGPFAGIPAGLKPGLLGEYFSGMNQNQLVTTRVDAAVDFKWKKGQAPAEGCSTPKYSVRWTGVLMIPPGGAAAIGIEADDGARMFLDGREILNFVHPQDKVIHAPVAAGPHAIELYYRNRIAGGSCRLHWVLMDKPDQEQVIPADALFHPDGTHKTR